MKKQQEIEKSIKKIGLERFVRYAKIHGMLIDEVTYGIREMFHKNKKSYCEAIDAIKFGPDNSSIDGWIINTKQGQKFVYPQCGYKVC